MIDLNLRSQAKQVAVAAITLLMVTLYVTVAGARLLAAHFSASSNPAELRKAAWLDGSDADYHYQVGRYELLAQLSPQAALPWLREAARLNPHSAKYWILLASAQQSLSDFVSEQYSLKQALAVDPRTPDVAWSAANLYLAQGSLDLAMNQFHAVLENDPPVTALAIETCWKIRPDIDYLLDNVVPPAAYTPMLHFLLSQKESAAAQKTWERIVKDQQPVTRGNVFQYVGYLIAQQQPSQAAIVWQEAATLSDLAAYEPSQENLLVNGDFSLAILNGGFDWVHRVERGVSVALDPNNSHSGSRSLRITFEGPAIGDAGILQLVALEPGRKYDFSAFYRAEDLDGAGGVQFQIQDAYSSTVLFTSDELHDADFWKGVGGAFSTGPSTDLVLLQLVRVPPGRPIKGTIWIDGLRLTRSEGHSSIAKELP